QEYRNADNKLPKNSRHPAITIAEHSCVVLRYLHSPKDK
ncbi:MAG: hypothetical protein ACI971_001227, partial [Colwellia sp.]